MDNGINIRRYLILGFLGLLIIWALVSLIHYLNTGSLSVSVSDSQDAVMVASVGNGGNKNSYFKQAKGHLTVRVPAGEYQISAQSHTWTVNKLVTVHARKGQSYRFSPGPILTPEPVTGTSAQDISADGSSLYYINPDLLTLYKIDSQNNLIPISTGLSINSVKWADSTYGIAQTTNNNLFVVNNGGVSPLKTPATFSVTKKINYAVSSQRKIYISINNDVYVGDDSGNFQKISSASAPPSQLAATSNSVGIVTLPKSQNGKPLLAMVSSAGKFIKRVSVDGGFVVFSPDGQRLAMNPSQQAGEIFDTSNNRIVRLPGGSSLSQVWLNNKTLLYSTGNALWSYSTDSGDAQMISSVPSGQSINNLYLDTARRLVYFSIQDSSGSEIDRVNLIKHTASSLIYQLGVFLPKTIGNCAINYVNFTSPTIFVAGPNAAQDCQGVVEAELVGDGLASSSLGINYINAVPIGSD